MRQFKDNADRTHQLAINTWALKRIRDSLELDLLDLGSEGERSQALLGRLMGDPVLLVDILYCILRPDLDAADISEEAFYKAMSDDAIDQATKALLEEIADFFPSPRDRARAHKVLAITEKFLDRAQDILDRRVEGGELEGAMEDALSALGAHGKPSTNSPAPSESTQAP